MLNRTLEQLKQPKSKSTDTITQPRIAYSLLKLILLPLLFMLEGVESIQDKLYKEKDLAEVNGDPTMLGFRYSRIMKRISSDYRVVMGMMRSNQKFIMHDLKITAASREIDYRSQLHDGNYAVCHSMEFDMILDVSSFRIKLFS
jgi:hypothetical protein